MKQSDQTSWRPNEDSETIGMPSTLTTQDYNEVTNLSPVSFLKRKLQKQFKEAS